MEKILLKLKDVIDEDIIYFMLADSSNEIDNNRFYKNWQLDKDPIRTVFAWNNERKLKWKKVKINKELNG